MPQSSTLAHQSAVPAQLIPGAPLTLPDFLSFSNMRCLQGDNASDSPNALNPAATFRPAMPWATVVTVVRVAANGSVCRPMEGLEGSPRGRDF